MPELPDVTVYVEHVAARVVGTTLRSVTVASPFVVRSYDPPIRDAAGRVCTAVRRVGKRIVLALEPDLFLSIHLMIAGRLRWKDGATPAKPPGRVGLAAFTFDRGTLILTEASTKRRAAVHLVRGEASLAALDRGGLEVLGATRDGFADALRRENHTLKRALTDPRLFSGIGNAYSDEILHRARLSPVRRTLQLDDDEITRLHAATMDVLTSWIARLRDEAGTRFPAKVTAFRPGMAVHGRYGQPCPVCGSKVQRIVYAENESNYCATCQTAGKLLADRALSRLLGEDWPRSLDELDAHVSARRKPG